MECQSTKAFTPTYSLVGGGSSICVDKYVKSAQVFSTSTLGRGTLSIFGDFMSTFFAIAESNSIVGMGLPHAIFSERCSALKSLIKSLVMMLTASSI